MERKRRKGHKTKKNENKKTQRKEGRKKKRGEGGSRQGRRDWTERKVFGRKGGKEGIAK